LLLLRGVLEGADHSLLCLFLSGTRMNVCLNLSIDTIDHQTTSFDGMLSCILKITTSPSVSAWDLPVLTRFHRDPFCGCGRGMDSQCTYESEVSLFVWIRSPSLFEDACCD
jgi:hypothetical protein